MIICSACGHRNGSTDAFCGSCGGFLEWDGQPVPAARRPVAAEVSAPSVRSVSPQPLPPGLGLPEQALDPALLVDPAPLEPGPFSVRVPQSEFDRPAPVRPDPVDVGPADLYCGRCGTGTAQGRSFCSRCGATLADATPVVRLPWWRRWWQALVGRLRRRRSYAAGERPDGWATLTDASSSSGRKRTWWRPRMPARLTLGRLALPLALLSLVGFGIAPLRAAVTAKGFALWHDIRGVVAPRFVPVSASGATATSGLARHDASMAIDQNTLTWWAEGAPGRGRGERLVVRVDRPVDLARVTVHNGAAEALFPFQPRARSLRVTLRGPDGVVDERRVLLPDKRGLQEVPVDGSGVTRVTLRILSTYAGQKGSAASLAEVGFFAKQ